MKKIVYSLLIASGALTSCGSGKESSAKNKSYSQDEIVAESKMANAFFDRVFDAQIDRDPMQQSLFSIKKDYGKWPDISEENSLKELEITKLNLDSLHTNFSIEALD